MNFTQKAEFAYKLTKKFGYHRRILVFLSKVIFTNQTKIIKFFPKSYLHPIYLRKNTSDIAVFEEIMLNRAYDINYLIQPKVIVDCGANIGLSAIFYANKFPEAKIICIEPELSNYEMLLKNTSSYTNIKAYQTGIWSKSTFLVIKNHGAAKYSFTVEETNENSQGAIQALSISDIMKMNGLDKIDILKIDIEGSEKEVFESNYEEWLPKCRVISIELHDRIRAGSSKSFFNTISKYSFETVIKGENIFCFMK